MREVVLRTWVWQQTLWPAVAERLRDARDDAGEGVISAAIAVLVMAFLGALMWVGFKATLGNAQGNVDNQVNQIGR